MRGLRSPDKATWVLLLLSVLAAGSACFLFLSPTKPPPPPIKVTAQPQNMPSGRQSSPSAQNDAGNPGLEPAHSATPPGPPARGGVRQAGRLVMLQLLRVVTNSHINVPLSCDANDPIRMAVVVGDNGGEPDWSHAKWLPYSSSVNVDLGESDGTKRVWIKAEWDDGGQSVFGTSTTLQRKSPVIAVTNPPSLLTARPMIQLQGYSDKPLASIHFDVINEGGVYTVTDGQGVVNEQYFDPTLFEVTTNYFTCYDIDLSRGTNTVVLRCTDNAGNKVTTNFQFVFSTAGHTNPPVITLAWPTNGSHVGGEDFTIRGQMDDPTATIMGWLTDSQGQTQAREGLVERNGAFWFDHIPTPESAGYVSLIAFDAATNSSAANFTIYRSHVELKMDPLPAITNQRTITVTGSIGRSNYAVWVNGAQAVVQPDGKWKAERVPVSPGGVATFHMSGRPIDTNAPDPDAGTNVPPPICWGQVTNQIMAGIYFPAPPGDQTNRYACDLYVMNTSASNQSLDWLRPKEHARFFAYLYGRDGTIVPRTMRSEPLELLPNVRMNIHHLGKKDVDLIDGVLDLPANTPVRVASLNLADWFSLTPGQYILEIGPQLFHVNQDGDLTPFDLALVGTNITVIRQP